MKNKPF